MANFPGTAVIEVRAGTSPTPVKELRPGDQLQPTSIGRNGMWQVDAPGVLDVHAYVYFDGQSLFMQSADPSNPAKGNGQTIGPAWQQIEIPCTIEVGRARLVYRTLEDSDDDDKTVARPIEMDAQMTPAAGSPSAGAPAMQPPAMQFRPPALVHRQEEEEKTRFAPMDFSSGGTPAADPHGRQPEPTVVAPMELQPQAPRARPAAGMPPPGGGNPWADGPQQGSTAVAPAPPAPQYQQWGSVQVQGGMQPGMMQPGMQPGMMQPQGGQYGQPGMQGGAYGQPGMQGGAYGQPGMQGGAYGQPGMQGGAYGPPGMQPGMQGGAYGQPGMMQGAPTEQGKVVTATGPLSPIDKFRAELNSLSPIKKIILFLVPIMAILLIREEDQSNQVPVNAPALDAGIPLDTGVSATNVTPTIALPTTTGVIPQPVPPIALDAGQNLTTPKDAGARSTERLAADAVADGKFATAIQLYDQLAATTPAGPEQDAFRAAAQILRAKLDGG